MRVQSLCLIVLGWLTSGWALADGAADPLRFVPVEADVVVKIERPRALVEGLLHDELVKGALKLSGVRELYDSTNLRRLAQLIAHVEKELGKDKLHLLDELFGGGIVLAGRFENPSAALLILQGRDEALMKRFALAMLTLAEQETARLEIKQPIRREKVDGVDVVRFGDACSALVDGALIVASHDIALRTVLDRQRERKPGQQLVELPEFQEGRKAIPAGAHAWTWLNLDRAKNLPGFKTGFEAATLDPNVTILLGGLIDVIKRAPFVTAYVAQEKSDWRLRVRFPRGTDGMSSLVKVMHPAEGPASAPCLQPPHTLASFSYFLDLGALWQHRNDIFNDKQVAAMDQVEKDIAKALLGAKLSNLFQQMGTHHRWVVASPGKSPYQFKPGTQIPAFAFVTDMRDPHFGKSANLLLRSFGLVGVLASKGSVKMKEQEHAGVKMLCFHFPEDKPFTGDPTGLRFNFTPAFAVVEDQVIFSSTTELCQDLIGELKRGARAPAHAATTRAQLYSRGAADALRLGKDQVLTQLILSQALAPDAARAEVERIISLVERLGTLAFDVHYGQNELRLDVNWRR